MKEFNVCSKCNSRLALAKFCGFYGAWNSEPYENGIEENVIYKNGEICKEPNTDNLWIYVNMCPDCGYVEFESLDND